MTENHNEKSLIPPLEINLEQALKNLERVNPKNLLGLLAAGIVNAFGVTVFLQPVKLYDSGVSGTSMLLGQLTPLSLSLFLVLLNIPLFLFGMKKQGKIFTIYSVFAVAVYSTVAWLITDVLPVDVQFASPLAGRDLLLCALFGGMISGTGSGLAIRFGGAMDGMDVLASIFAKDLGLTVGSFTMIYNVILYITIGCVMKSWILPLYSIVTYMAAMKTVDFITEGIDRSKSAMIVTEHPKEVAAALMTAFGVGATLMDVRGAYSNEPKTMIYFVTNRFQIPKMRNLVRRIDPMAYIAVSDVADVFRKRAK